MLHCADERHGSSRALADMDQNGDSGAGRWIGRQIDEKKEEKCCTSFTCLARTRHICAVHLLRVYATPATHTASLLPPRTVPHRTTCCCYACAARGVPPLTAHALIITRTVA